MNRLTPVTAALALAGAAAAQDVPELSGAPLPPGADVVFLGEIHDNPAHHMAQADFVTRIAPTALVFEMLDADEAALVVAERSAGRFDDLAETLDWDESGWPDFAMYAQVMEAAPQAAIYGAEVPRDRIGPVIQTGAAAEFGAEARRFGLQDALPEDQQASRETMQAEAHCNALPEDLLPGFVEAQRLRDARIAEAALEALSEHGAPVVVITGNGHARTDWGAPALVTLAAPGTEVFSIAMLESAPDADLPADAWLVTAPTERPDPCAAFQ